MWTAAHPTGRAARLAAVFGALAATVPLHIPLCVFAIVTRHPCPGCGLTRAALALSHADLHAAMAFHPLSPIAVPLAAVVLVVNAISYVRFGRWSTIEGLRGRSVTVFAAIFGAVFLGVWIARFLGAFGGPVPV